MPLKHRHLCDIDPTFFFRKLRSGKSLVRYHKGTVIYAQGDPSDAVFYLQSGQVNLTVCSPRGKQAIIGILRTGDFLGEGCLVGRTTRAATATATSDSTAIRVEKRAMARFLRTEQKLANPFLSYLLMREIQIEEDLIDRLLNSTQKRLARALLQLSQVRKGHGSEVLISQMTHETLAQMIGATRAQVSTLMSQFRKKGYVHYDGELRVNESLVDFLLNN